MIKKILFSIIYFICVISLFSLDIAAYAPVEYVNFINFFRSSEDEGPGIKIFAYTSFRVHANLPEYPREIDASDIDNIRDTVRSLGLHPNVVSEIGYKVEYVNPSNVEWQEETRLIFYIQKVL